MVFTQNISMSILRKFDETTSETNKYKSKLKYLLPKSLDDLNWISENKLSQIPSQCPQNVRGTNQIFVFPGFRSFQDIQAFTTSLYYPVFLIEQKSSKDLSLKNRVQIIVQVCF